MTAAVLALRGRPSRAHIAALHDDARTARDELAEHCREAVEFVDACIPLIDAIERVAAEVDPRFHAIVRQLAYRHDQYQRRHLAEGDDPAEAVAA